MSKEIFKIINKVKGVFRQNTASPSNPARENDPSSHDLERDGIKSPFGPPEKFNPHFTHPI